LLRALTLREIAALKEQHAVRFLETINSYHELLVNAGGFQRGYGAVSVLLEMSEAIEHAIDLATVQGDAAAGLSAGEQLSALVEVLGLTFGADWYSQYTDLSTSLTDGIRSISPEDLN
jgi:hypothetical protein